MRVLVVAPQPFFTPRGTPFSVYYRTAVTAGLGLEVDLLTYGEGQDVDLPGVRIVRIPRFGFLGPVRTGPSLQKAFLDVFMVLWTFGLLLRHRYAIVHAHEEAVFFCRYFKPLFRFRLIYDMHSSLPQQLSNFAFTESKLLHGLFRWQEDRAIAKADAVITICPDLADYVNERIDDPDKHFLIENSIFDPVRLRAPPTGAPATAAQHAGAAALPSGRRFVVYAGTLEHYQGIDMLIDGFPDVLARCPDAFLVVVGGTPEQAAACRQRAAALGLDAHCLFTGRLPQADANRYLDRASVLLSSRSEGTNTPLKVYQQLASGVPLVATNIYSHTQVLDDDVAFLVEPTAKGLAAGIVAALGDTDAAARKAAAAQALYQRKYSREAYLSKLEGVFKRLR